VTLADLDCVTRLSGPRGQVGAARLVGSENVILPKSNVWRPVRVCPHDHRNPTATARPPNGLSPFWNVWREISDGAVDLSFGCDCPRPCDPVCHCQSSSMTGND
jgi:hypothetical protein